MAGSKKKEQRIHASVCAAFGSVNWHNITFEQYVGLWLNEERAWMRKAIEVCRGIQMSLAEGALPRAWYDALCLFEEQVDEVEFQTNCDRVSQHVQSHPRQW